MKLLIHWLISAVLLLVVSHVVPGFHVSTIGAALIAALVVGFVNATLGLLLKVVTFPLTILTFGIFLIVINALMLKLSATVVPGFRISGFMPAFWGAVLLAVLDLVVKWLTPEKQRR
jgi:putative membrane protein